MGNKFLPKDYEVQEEEQEPVYDLPIEKIEVESVILTADQWESMPTEQQERLQLMKRHLTNYKAVLHTFKKKYYKTNIYPDSHNDRERNKNN